MATQADLVSWAAFFREVVATLAVQVRELLSKCVSPSCHISFWVSSLVGGQLLSSMC
jgi:hypothetical protein